MGRIVWPRCRQSADAGQGAGVLAGVLRHRALPLVGQFGLTEAELLLDALHPVRSPPAVIAEQLHDGRYQEHPDHRGVQQQGDEQTESQVLHHHQVGEGERADHHCQHQGRTGDQTAGGRGTDANGLRGGHAPFPGLHHAGYQEDLVVGGQAPDHGDDQADHRCHQWLRGVVEQPGTMTIFDEHPGQDAHCGPECQRAHECGLDRQHYRSECQEHQDGRGENEDHRQQRQVVEQALNTVLRQSRRAAYEDLSAVGCGQGPQFVDLRGCVAAVDQAVLNAAHRRILGSAFLCVAFLPHLGRVVGVGEAGHRSGLGT